MTAAQHKARIKRITKAWKGRLALDHFTLAIEWDEDPEDVDALASIYVSEYYDYATLRFRGDLIDFPVEELNRIIVHELMHVLMHDYGMAARSITVTGALSTDVRMLWHDRCHDAEERVVDRLASRLVELGGIIE